VNGNYRILTHFFKRYFVFEVIKIYFKNLIFAVFIKIKNLEYDVSYYFSEHDPIVISQKEREQFRRELFSTTPKLNEEANNGKTQPPLHVFNGSEIKAEDDINGNRCLWRAQQIPNRIRRLRSRHVPLGGKLWFPASNTSTFNSRCPSSFRFDRKNVDEDARQYYFYR
jgi:hypothetical protein